MQLPTEWNKKLQRQIGHNQKWSPAAPSLSDLWVPAAMQLGLFSAKFHPLMQQKKKSAVSRIAMDELLQKYNSASFWEGIE